MRNTLRTVLDRIVKKEASEKDIKLTDKFIHYSQRDNQDIPEEVKTSIWDKVKAETIDEPSKVISMAPIWRVAASIAIVLGIAIVLYLSQSTTGINYLTKSTERGQKATITLSDGSTVRLNSESSITYPESFAEEIRELELVGEAFFDIKKDQDRPFIVSSHKIETTVLGTSFNINAYDSTAVSVALVSGKVKVNTTQNNTSFNQFEVYLNPGERAFYDGQSGDINVGSFNEKKLTAWKDGVIYLVDADHDEVFNKLSRWYGVKFHLVNQPKGDWEYTGEFDDLNLTLVLNTIGYAGGFNYKINGKTVEVEFQYKK